MPSVDVAMARSLRGGIWGSIAAGLGQNLERRQITDTVSEVSQAFSSWDNCMARDYCKWPVIAVIVVGGLIIFSVVWCLARCLCCGLSCCCSCFKCLKCCGNCCGCCDAPGERKHKYLDDPYADQNQGYKSQAPMFAPSVHPVSQNNIGPSTANSPPQYAEFDVSRKRDSNALPAMPTWESSNAKRVSLEEIVELEPMKKPQASQSALSVNTGPQDPLMQSRQNTQPSPVNGGGGYGGQPGQSQDPYSPAGQKYDTYNDNGYGQQQGNSSYGQEPGYGPGAAMGMGPGRTRTPHQDRNGYRSPGHQSPGPQQDYNGYDQPGYGQQNSYGQQSSYGQQNGYEQDAYGIGRGPASPGPGGRGYPARTGPSPAPAGYRRSPGPQNDMGYNRQDPYADSAYDRPQYPEERQYSNNSSQRMQAPPSPGPQNSGGFDFQSGYSRPSHFDDYDGPPPRPAQQDRPPPSSGSEIIYPGYKAYQPAQQGWSGV